MASSFSFSLNWNFIISIPIKRGGTKKSNLGSPGPRRRFDIKKITGKNHKKNLTFSPYGENK
jgi:hypothetical protein